jgi:hypothetical protein
MMSLRLRSLSSLLIATFSLGCTGTVSVEEAAGSAGGSIVAGGATSAGGSPATPCLDTTNDPHNCGQCGHDCLGGACAAGRCQPVVLASGERFPNSITSDGSEVFWANWVQMGPADNVPTILRAVGVDGAGLRTVGTAPYFPGSLHADETSLYWYRSTINSQPEGGAVMKMAKTGGPPTILVDHTLDSWLGIAVGPKDVYWWPGAGATAPSGTLWKVGKDGTGAKPVGSAGTFYFASVLEVDEHAAYGALYGSGGIVRIDLAGGPPVVLADVETRWVLAIDDTRVFFTSPLGLQRIGKDGSDLTLLLAADLVGETVVDATHLYYVSHDGIRRMTKDGAGDELLVAEPPGAEPQLWSVHGIAQDDHAIYFVLDEAVANSASIMKIAK